MPENIRVVIEGDDPVAAAEDLLAIPGILGSWTPISEEPEKGVIETVALIVGIIGSTIAIAEQIRKWFQESKLARAGKRFDVVIETEDYKILLEDANAEEIYQMLKVLERQSD